VSLLNDWLGVKGIMRLDRTMSDRWQRDVLLESDRSHFNTPERAFGKTSYY
jgi:hypothetical protein